MQDTFNLKTEAIALFKYCSVCGNKLCERKVADIFIFGLSCKGGHQYHVPLKEVYVDEQFARGQSKELEFASSDSLAIAKTWLTDINYRKYLNDQLAEVLRLFLEIKSRAYNFDLPRESDFKLCPICSALLHVVEQDDIWIRQLDCLNGHVFDERRGLLFITAEGAYLNLCMDMNYEFLISCINAYLNEKTFKIYTPDQVRNLLLYFLKELPKK